MNYEGGGGVSEYSEGRGETFKYRKGEGDILVEKYMSLIFCFKRGRSHPHLNLPMILKFEMN